MNESQKKDTQFIGKNEKESWMIQWMFKTSGVYSSEAKYAIKILLYKRKNIFIKFNKLFISVVW